ncbi:MAG: hypothetical protein COV72_03430 [Candidatus Omnitrophica bacterium CG11_big_fil_rev_8_21_14_0_20_42_13]|uniref:Formyl transferase N-terminal domain-containing protein n=1 Tax=Candidatus Ghiorseimicrobium undicola TaxID=1974746 RepID=A0A2H0LYE5_9BACT|nr:MAG: hypothetical protein COV72_03430 [Candidatus Omnitrophica bacterium CG11_big_fil_rev_8_21_14_0_20_42_13]
MPEKRKICVFIGNRPAILQEIMRIKELQLAHVFILKNSFLYKNRHEIPCRYTVFGKKDKEKVVSGISRLNFDILISNGCPFVFPGSIISRPGKIFLNIHPSYLPYFRGMHPVNGILLRGFPYAGATMHFISDGIDTGNIIHREKFRLSADIDAGLLYRLVFTLEGKVFAAGMRKLIRSRFRYKGLRQKRLQGDYYTRSLKDMRLSLAMSSKEMLSRIRAFGVGGQGARCRLNGMDFSIFEAEAIHNEYLMRNFSRAKAGEILLEYEGKILFKTKDGIIKIKRFLRNHSGS